MDTVPAIIKPFFWSNKKAPSLQNDYDVIGFEVNHCIAKYNIIETTKLIVEVLLDELYNNLGYPSEILKFNYDKNISVASTNLIWDIDYGTLLKIANQCEITHAILGNEKLGMD
jgi:hypothetical protein